MLHYAQAPERVIAETARVLGPGGRLLVVDFAPHEHESCACATLMRAWAISDRQMEAWFAAAGLDLAGVEGAGGGHADGQALARAAAVTFRRPIRQD